MITHKGAIKYGLEKGGNKMCNFFTISRCFIAWTALIKELKFNG